MPCTEDMKPPGVALWIAARGEEFATSLTVHHFCIVSFLLEERDMLEYKDLPSLGLEFFPAVVR